METLRPAEGRLEVAKYLKEGFEFKLYKRLLKIHNATEIIVLTQPSDTYIEIYIIAVNTPRCIGVLLAYEKFSMLPMCSLADNIKLAFEDAYFSSLLNMNHPITTYQQLPVTYVNDLYKNGSLIALLTEQDTMFPILFVSENDFEVAPL